MINLNHFVQQVGWIRCKEHVTSVRQICMSPSTERSLTVYDVCVLQLLRIWMIKVTPHVFVPFIDSCLFNGVLIIFGFTQMTQTSMLLQAFMYLTRVLVRGSHARHSRIPRTVEGKYPWLSLWQWRRQWRWQCRKPSGIRTLADSNKHNMMLWCAL